MVEHIQRTHVTHDCMGCLVIDVDSAVYDQEGHIIPGLYTLQEKSLVVYTATIVFAATLCWITSSSAR